MLRPSSTPTDASTFASDPASGGAAIVRGLHAWRTAWIAIGVAILVVLAEHASTAIAERAGLRLSVHASIVAALLLAASAVLYVAGVIQRAPAIGRAAAAAAKLGATGLIGASLARWVEAHWLAPGHVSFALQYELLTWAAALSVYGYLRIEAVYRNQVAGAFVLTCVLIALGLAAWLIDIAPIPDAAFTSIAGSYLRWALRASIVIGAVGVALVAACGIAALMLTRPHGVGRSTLLARLRERASMVGFCALTFAVLLDAAARMFFGGIASDVNSAPILYIMWLPVAVVFALAVRSGRDNGRPAWQARRRCADSSAIHRP